MAADRCRIVYQGFLAKRKEGLVTWLTYILALSVRLPRTRKMAQYAGNQRSLFPLNLERLLRNGAMPERKESIC